MTVLEKNNIITEQIGDCYLVMVGEKNDECIYLSELAMEILDMCDGEHGVEDIVDQIMRTYEVTYEECCDDVMSCVRDLVDTNIIKLKKEVS